MKHTAKTQAKQKHIQRHNRKPVKNKPTIEGIFQGKSRGYGFAITAKGDYYVAPKNTNGAQHKDTVSVQVTNQASKECKIVKIIKRGIETMSGTFELANGKNGFVVADDKAYFTDIFVPYELSKKAKQGDKVLVKILSYPKNNNPQGEIIKVFGKSGTIDAELNSIIAAQGFVENFTQDALLEARNAAHTADTHSRRDLTDELVVTIDGADAKDLDDAVSLKKTDNGYELGVHIADVSQYVSRGGVLDKEAYMRGTSVYFADKVFPMLPRELSNGLCSLTSDSAKLTLSCVIRLTKQGKVQNYEIFESTIKTAHRMTYDEVEDIVVNNKVGDKFLAVADMLKDMGKLTKMLIDIRHKRGNIDFDLSETGFCIDDGRRVVDVYKKKRLFSHRIIEEFMILANTVVAKHISDLKLPFVYRIHGKPSKEKLEAFAELVEGCGFPLKSDVEKLQPIDFSSLLDKIANTPYADIISKVMLRAMQKAEYNPQNIGHFGLAEQFYCHFTSPIRRYPDLIVHRILKQKLNGGLDSKTVNYYRRSLAETSKHCSERERAAEEGERKVDDLLKAAYMKDHIGEIFSATISGVTQFGLFAELENGIEGLIRIEALPNDSYEFDDRRFKLKGKKCEFNLGKKIKVRCEGADIESRRIDFGYIN